MSLHSQQLGEIPLDTVRVARAAFPCMQYLSENERRIRDFL